MLDAEKNLALYRLVTTKNSYILKQTWSLKAVNMYDLLVGTTI